MLKFLLRQNFKMMKICIKVVMKHYKKEKMGKWTGNIPKTISLYERVGDELWLPFGCLQQVWSMCVRGVSWDVQISSLRQIKYHSSISPYPYQEAAINAAKNSVFAPDRDAAELQKGTITYKFIIRQ